MTIGISLLGRLQILHQKGFIHNDLKPDNIMIGGPDEINQIYLIDFGIS